LPYYHASLAVGGPGTGVIRRLGPRQELRRAGVAARDAEVRLAPEGAADVVDTVFVAMEELGSASRSWS